MLGFILLEELLELVHSDGQRRVLNQSFLQDAGINFSYDANMG